MKFFQYILPLLKIFLFWLILFFTYKVLFLAIYFSHTELSSYLEVAQSLYKGVELDASMVAYFMELNMLVFLFFGFFTSEKLFKVKKKMVFILHFIFTTAYLLACSAELATYAEWEAKPSAKILLHLQHPSEIIAVSTPFYTLLFFGSFIPLFILSVYSYKKWINNKWLFEKPTLKWFIKTPLNLVIVGVFIIIIRGGLQAIPIQVSNAYYSSNQFLNDVSTNTLWGFVHSVIDSKAGLKGNPYKYINDTRAKKLVADLYKTEKDTTINILTTTRPNIVYIMLESWSADCIESLGGYHGVTPQFDKLTKKGLLFSNFYSCNWTSDQAMSAIFSSAVTFPNFAVVNNPSAFRNIPSIIESLHSSNYNSSYFYGGQLEYGNIKGFILNKGFQKVKEGSDYSSLGFKTGKMGIQDGDMTTVFINEINKLKEPFFTNWFTISSHSPYDHPGSKNITWGEKDNAYLNSVAYTDSCLNLFFRLAKQEDWYSNTLFLLLADHGHVSPKKWASGRSEKQHIPFLLYGEVIKPEFKGDTIFKYGSNLDINATLLHQLKINYDTTLFPFSKNLLNPYSKDFSPFVFHGGIGLKTPIGEYSYSTILKRDIRNTDTLYTVVAKENARAFYQVAFDYFYKP